MYVVFTKEKNKDVVKTEKPNYDEAVAHVNEFYKSLGFSLKGHQPYDPSKGYGRFHTILILEEKVAEFVHADGAEAKIYLQEHLNEVVGWDLYSYLDIL